MFSFLFRGLRKSLFVFLPLALLAGYSIDDALSHYHGMPDQAYLGGCDAATLQDPCHGTSNGSTKLHIFLPDTIFAGRTYTLRFSVSNLDPRDSAAGFDLDVDTPAMLDTIPGMYTILTPPLQYEVYSITHSQPQQFVVNGVNRDSAVWSMLYTARPTAGFDTIYAAGNAVDDDSASPDLADHWDSITQIITVLPAPSLVGSISSSNSVQVYPNPASNEIFLNDGIPADVGTYTLTDAAGRMVQYDRQTPLDGNHSIDISTIAAGTYILSVQPRMGKALSRSIVIQR